MCALQAHIRGILWSVKYFAWDDAKNAKLRKERGIGFEDVVFHVERGDLVRAGEPPRERRADQAEEPRLQPQHVRHLTVAEARHVAGGLQVCAQVEHVDEHLGVRIRVDVPQIRPEHLLLQLIGIRQVAVMAQDDAEGRIDVEGLRLGGRPLVVNEVRCLEPRALLRLEPDIRNGEIRIAPAVPRWAGRLHLEEIPFMGGSLSIEVEGEHLHVVDVPEAISIVHTPRRPTA